MPLSLPSPLLLVLASVVVAAPPPAQRPAGDPPPQHARHAAPDQPAAAAASWTPTATSPPPFVTAGQHHSRAGPDYGYDSARRVTPRRIVYYADLPDVPASKYSRQGRYEGSYSGQAPSYTIIDADPEVDRRRLIPAPTRPTAPLPDTRYNRIPAPYAPPAYRDRSPATDYVDYRRPDVGYRRPEPSYRRPPLDYGRRPLGDSEFSRPEYEYRRPLQYSPDYRRPDIDYRRPEQVPSPGYRRPLAPEAPVRRPLLPADAAQPRPEDDPYRDYNPRQPAPWSMQIGARLTVKDDGRRPPGATSGRRFYVNSQEPGPHYAIPLTYPQQ